MRKVRGLFAVAALLGAVMAAHAEGSFGVILSDNFSTDPLSNGWTYSGVQDTSGNNLLRWDAANQNIAAQWDQTNSFSTASTPNVYTPSRLTKPLGMTLTDNDSFVVSATLRLNSVANNKEYFEIANFGLYNVAATGPDRAMGDDYSGNLVKDASDFIEFNYFTGVDGNSSWPYSRCTQVTVGTHITGNGGNYIFDWDSGDPLHHSTEMGGTDAASAPGLPLGTDMYIQLSYDAATRRGKEVIYTDAAHTQVLSMLDPDTGLYVDQWCYTPALGSDDHFSLTDVGFWNYVGPTYSGDYASGTGTFDDISVTVVPEPASMTLLLLGMGALIRRKARNGIHRRRRP